MFNRGALSRWTLDNVQEFRMGGLFWEYHVSGDKDSNLQ